MNRAARFLLHSLCLASVYLAPVCQAAAKSKPETAKVITWQLPLRWPETTALCGRFTRVSVDGSHGDQVTEWIDDKGTVLFKMLRVGSQKVDLDEATLRTQSTFVRTDAGSRAANLTLGCGSVELTFRCELAARACEWTVKRDVKNPLTQEAVAKEDPVLAILENQERWKKDDPALKSAALVLVGIAADSLELACAGDLCKASVRDDIAKLRSLRADEMNQPTFDLGSLGSVRFSYRGNRSLSVSCKRLDDFRKCYLNLETPSLNLYENAHANAHQHELRDPGETWNVRIDAYRLDAPTAAVRTSGKLIR